MRVAQSVVQRFIAQPCVLVACNSLPACHIPFKTAAGRKKQPQHPVSCWSQEQETGCSVKAGPDDMGCSVPYGLWHMSCCPPTCVSFLICVSCSSLPAQPPRAHLPANTRPSCGQHRQIGVLSVGAQVTDWAAADNSEPQTSTDVRCRPDRPPFPQLLCRSHTGRTLC